MRFTAYNQYVHRMLHRWGPNVKEMMAIKKYLATQSITLTHPPWVQFHIYDFFLLSLMCLLFQFFFFLIDWWYGS